MTLTVNPNLFFRHVGEIGLWKDKHRYVGNINDDRRLRHSHREQFRDRHEFSAAERGLWPISDWYDGHQCGSVGHGQLLRERLLTVQPSTW